MDRLRACQIPVLQCEDQRSVGDVRIGLESALVLVEARKARCQDRHSGLSLGWPKQVCEHCHTMPANEIDFEDATAAEGSLLAVTGPDIHLGWAPSYFWSSIGVERPSDMNAGRDR